MFLSFAIFFEIAKEIKMSESVDELAVNVGGDDSVVGIYDVVVIGSGPAGYTAGIYAGRSGASVAVIEGESELGGALMLTSRVDNYPGFPEGVDGPELMMSMREQCGKFVQEMVEESAVEIINMDAGVGGLSRVVTESGKTYLGRSLIVATGSEHRKLDVPGEEEFSIGGGVSYCATCDAAFFQGRKVVVVGGGDTAMEDASVLSRFASEVVLVHRREQFKASQAMVDKVSKLNNVSFVMDSVVLEIVGENGNVVSVIVKNILTDEETVLPCDGVFVAIGSDPRVSLLKDNVELHVSGHVVMTNEPHTDTSLPNVFACGDVVDDHYQQAITSAGSGCRAGLDAVAYVLETVGSLTQADNKKLVSDMGLEV